MKAQKQALIDQLLNNERALFKVFDNIDDMQACTARVSSKWSVRDELAHIISWIEEIFRGVEFALSNPGGIIPWEVATDSSITGYDKWNQARIQELAMLTVQDLLSRYKSVNARLIHLIQKLEDAHFRSKITIRFEGERTIPQLISIHTDHEGKHLKRSGNALAESGIETQYQNYQTN